MDNNNFGLADDPVVKATDRISETANAVTKQSRELADIIATVSAGWTGVGAGGFIAAQETVNQDHDKIRSLLGVLHHAVGQTKNLSNAQDDEVLQAFKAIRADSAPGNTSGLNGI